MIPYVRSKWCSLYGLGIFTSLGYVVVRRSVLRKYENQDSPITINPALIQFLVLHHEQRALMSKPPCHLLKEEERMTDPLRQITAANKHGHRDNLNITSFVSSRSMYSL